MTPFTLHVPDADIADLRERLARTRFPDAAPGEPWAYGTSVDYLRSLVAYWRDGFDWRAAEARLNAFPQFKLVKDDIDLHFLHVPGKGPSPMPLLLMHGWPGSVFEFLDFIPRLTDPAAFGGDPADAFTVVAPSLPGYGLSFRPGQKRYGVEEIAAAMVELMTATLGYERFAVQGGDWGAITAGHMGAAYPEKLIGLHVNMLAVPRDRGALGVAADDPEHRAFFADLKHWLDEETGYQGIQGTKPQTLSFALTDSPAGLAAWIVEKFRTWTDCGGDVETALTRDQMLANISFYWFTGAIGSSFYPYYFRKRRRLAGLARAPGDRADRLRRIPQGNAAAAARHRREELHRHPPLDRHAQGRPFRGDGAAGGAGGGGEGVFQGVAVGGRGVAVGGREAARAAVIEPQHVFLFAPGTHAARQLRTFDWGGISCMGLNWGTVEGGELQLKKCAFVPTGAPLPTKCRAVSIARRFQLTVTVRRIAEG